MILYFSKGIKPYALYSFPYSFSVKVILVLFIVLSITLWFAICVVVVTLITVFLQIILYCFMDNVKTLQQYIFIFPLWSFVLLYFTYMFQTPQCMVIIIASNGQLHFKEILKWEEKYFILLIFIISEHIIPLCGSTFLPDMIFPFAGGTSLNICHSSSLLIISSLFLLI